MNYSRYLSRWHLSRQLGRQERAHPHRLRHGAASADAMNHATDLTLMERGPRATIRGVARYTTPARYLHQLSLLSEEYLARARGAPQRIVQDVKTMVNEVCITGGRGIQCR